MRLRLATKIVLALAAVLAGLLLVINLASYRHTRSLVADVKRAQLEAEFRRFEQQLVDIADARAHASLTAARLGEWIYAQHQAGVPVDVKAATEAACASVLEAQSSAVLGVGMWFEPSALGVDHKWVGPYAARSGDKIAIDYEYATDAYDYPNQPWYTMLVPRDWPRAKRVPKDLGNTEPYLDKLDGAPTVFQTTARVMHAADGRVIGVVTVDTTLTSVQQLLREFQVTPSSTAFLLSPSGAVLYPVARPDALDQVDSLPYHGALSLDGLVAGRIQRAADVQVGEHVADIVYARLPDGDTLGVVLATDEAYAVLGDVATQSLLYGVLAIVATAIAIAFLVRRQLRPLGAVTVAAQRVAGGDLDVQMRATSRDEIGELAGAFSHMVREVKQRDEALREHARNLEGLVAQRTRSIQLILDSTGEALVPTRRDGTIAGAVSHAGQTWFGPPRGEPKVWDYLARGNDAVAFELAFGQLADAILPFELLCDQMPQRLERDGRTIALEYREVADGGDTAFLIIASDITAQIASEQRERELREITQVLSTYMRDRHGFRRGLDECGALLTRCEQDDAVALKRDLHTLKGTSAILGFTGFAAACHALEDRLAEGAEASDGVAALRTEFERQLAAIEHIVESKREVVEFTSQEYESILALVRAHADHDVLLAMLRSARLQPVGSYLGQLAQQVQRLGTQLGRAVEVRIDDDGHRVAPGAARSLFASLVHAVRNAIDHGIESQARREAAGKPPHGTLTLSARVQGTDLCVAIADDGCGIDWDAVRTKARAAGLPHDSRAALEDALFADGLSTRDEVSELSGRGVGLAVVRAAAVELGGRVAIDSAPGRGTTLRVYIPVAALTEDPVPAGAARRLA